MKKYKTPGRKDRRNFYKLDIGKDFLNSITKALTMKKVDKFEFIKIFKKSLTRLGIG